MDFSNSHQNPLEEAKVFITENIDNSLESSPNNLQQLNSFENQQVKETAELLAASIVKMTIPVAEEIIVMGDITKDGGVDGDDVRELLRSYRPGIASPDDSRDINGDGLISLRDVRDLGISVRNNTDKTAPDLLAGLVNDTGSLNNDQLTSDASISGTLTDENLITRFSAGFDDTTVDNYVNILGILNEDGTFSLDETQLQEINKNNPLLDGEYTLHLFTKDQWNNITTFDLDFILDSNAPNISISLLNDRGISDTDNITNDPTLIGKITDLSEIDTFELRNNLSSSSVDITNLIEADGSFTISERILEQVNNNSPLLDEVNSFSFIGIDSAGNVSDRIVFDFTLDTNSSFPTITTDFSQPITETTLLTGSIVEDLSGLDSLTYSFSNIKKIDIIVDEFRNFSQPFDLTGVENGIYNLIIESSDIAGNGQGLITAIVTVGDIIPPELSVGLINDTGRSDTDNITNDPTLTGSITDFSEIETLELINNLSLSSVDITNLIEADGSFTINESILEQINNNSPLLNGNYSVSLVGTDTAGNISNSLEFSFALDRQDPSLSIFLISFPGDGADFLGGSVQDNQLGDTGVASLTLQIDEGEITDIPFSEGEQINVNLNDFNLTSGEHLFTVTATDIAGNNTTFRESLLIDNVLAELTIGLTNDTGRSDNDNISNVLGITGTLIDDNPITTFEAGLNNGGTLDVLDTLQPDGTFIFDQAKLQEIATASNVNLIPGEYTLDLTFNDGDFVLATLLFPFTFDPIPAFPTVTTDFSKPITKTTLLTGSIVEEISGLDRLFYRFGDGEEIDIIVDEFGNFSQPFDLTAVSNGIYELRIDSIDIAGNRVGLAIENITVGDINIPELTIRLVEDTGISDSDSITQNLAFLGTVKDESEITILDVTLNNSSTGVRNTLSILDQVQPDGSFTIDEALLQQINQEQPLNDGNYQLSIRASDEAGNTGILLNPFLVLDTENPSLTINTPMDNGILNEGDRLTGNTDGTGSEIVSISYQFDDGVEIPITVDNDGNFDQELDLTGLEFREYTLTVTAIDQAGNITQTSQIISLENNEVENFIIMPGDRLQINLPTIFTENINPTYLLSSEQTLPTGMLEANNQLVFNPNEQEIGSYEFTVTAVEGETETSKNFLLEVVADPVTTTRISGVIENTDQEPLEGVVIELGNLQTVTNANGEFIIETPGELPSDTLKIRGETITGDVTYPFIAEKLPLLLERDAITGVNNVISRPIYLPPIDIANAVTIDPNIDVTVTTDNIANASVFVAAGSLETPEGEAYTGELSITEVPRELTPAALPENLMPDLVVTIQPGEMVFNTPALLSLPNLAGYEPGTEMNLWSINPETGLFDNVGTGQVSNDGTVIETIDGGINNSSWHFFAPPPEESNDPEENERNEDDQCEECKATASGTSVVQLHSGAVIETHNLVSYQSLGVDRGFTLTYDSERADSRPILYFDYSNVVFNENRRLMAELTVQQGQFEYEIAGGRNYWSIPQGGGNIEAALQGDMRGLSSGRYDYELSTGLLQLNGETLNGSTLAYTGDIIHVNSIGSIFGNGWGLSGLEEIVENADGSVLIIDGNGGELLFEALEEGGYDSPPGDFSLLEKLEDGTFRRTMTDQMVYSFNADNKIASVSDRNGNTTQYPKNCEREIATSF